MTQANALGVNEKLLFPRQQSRGNGDSIDHRKPETPDRSYSMADMPTWGNRMQLEGSMPTALMSFDTVDYFDMGYSAGDIMFGSRQVSKSMFRPEFERGSSPQEVDTEVIAIVCGSDRSQDPRGEHLTLRRISMGYSDPTLPAAGQLLLMALTGFQSQVPANVSRLGVQYPLGIPVRNPEIPYSHLQQTAERVVAIAGDLASPASGELVGASNLDDLESRFRFLADQWREETGMFSLEHQMTRHAAYQQIKDMGERAVPLILRELKDRPYHWFGMLNAITDEDPIPPEDAGYFQKMTDAWIGWGQRKGHIS